MLKIYDPTNHENVIPLQLDDNKRYVKHTYDGYDTLNFEIESTNPLYKFIVEETIIEDEKNRYVVKLVDEHSTFVTVKCDLDLDDWRKDIIYEYRKTYAKIDNLITELLPKGWSVEWKIDIPTRKTTIEGNEGEPIVTATPLEIMGVISETYSVVFNWDVINKKVIVDDPTTRKSSGQFFMEDLNLKDIGFVGNSANFATRLYAFGKKDGQGNPMTFADINDGKPYVEDFTYSDKIVCVGWSDERYTVKETLLSQALVRLKQLSYPERSYTCNAYNMQGDIELYRVVTLVDKKHGKRITHQIVEWNEYPNSVKDTITLSKTTPTIESFVSNVQTGTSAKIEENAALMQSLIREAVDYATKKITGSSGGNFLWVFDSDDKPIELLWMTDTLDIKTAKSVFRFNTSGLSHSAEGYSGAAEVIISSDGSINATAIRLGIMLADLIKKGKLEDLLRLSSWDMETGKLRLSTETLVGTEETNQKLMDYIISLIPPFPEIPEVPVITDFTDLGESVIPEEGMMTIELSESFKKIMLDKGITTFQVFIQEYGAGSIYVSKRTETNFSLVGTAGTSFGWMVRAKVEEAVVEPEPDLPPEIDSDTTYYLNVYVGENLVLTAEALGVLPEANVQVGQNSYVISVSETLKYEKNELTTNFVGLAYSSDPNNAVFSADSSGSIKGTVTDGNVYLVEVFSAEPEPEPEPEPDTSTEPNNL